MESKTTSGFSFKVNEKLGNDFRFILALDDFTNGDADTRLSAMARLARIVLGDDGARALYRHVKEEDGTVPTDKVMHELTEIINLSKEKPEIKN